MGGVTPHAITEEKMANEYDCVIKGLLEGVAGRCKEGNASLQRKIEGAEAPGACYCDVSMLDIPKFCEYQGDLYTCMDKAYSLCKHPKRPQ